MQDKIRDWLNKRGITNEVLTAHDIRWDNEAILIPILNAAGEVSHIKYRKSPLKESDLPKYWQDNGASAQLYNRHNAHLHKHVIICEGELDVLRLESEGFYAVSSTSGAGTFKQEWAELFANHSVVICYDLDDAGLVGMQKVATMFPGGCLLAVLPESVGEHGDITDYLNDDNKITDLKGGKFSYLVDEVLVDCKKKEKIAYYRRELELIINMQRAINANRRTKPVELHYLYNFFNDKIRKLTSPKQHKLEGDEVKKAQAVLLTNLYEGDLQYRGGKAYGLCPIHNENHSSFVIYIDQNSWYCYGACGKGGDSIAFIMERDELSFKEAVKKLNA